MTSYDWLIGLALIVGLAFFFSYITYRDLSSFFIFLTIFNAFVVWIGFLPLWTLILNLIVLIGIIYVEINNKRGI